MKNSDLCRKRSAHAGELLPHLFTTRIRINGTPQRIVCSWCGKAQP